MTDLERAQEKIRLVAGLHEVLHAVSNGLTVRDAAHDSDHLRTAEQREQVISVAQEVVDDAGGLDRFRAAWRQARRRERRA